MECRRTLWIRPIGIWIALLCAGLLQPPLAYAEVQRIVHQDDPELPRIARETPLGEGLRIEGLFLEALGYVDLDLERFRVFAEDALILAGEQRLNPPDIAYFRGSIDSVPDSLAVLGLRPSGRIEGLITAAGEAWKVRQAAGAGGIGVYRLDVLEEYEARPFDCQSDSSFEIDVATDDSNLRVPAAAGAYSYTARVAFETDWEFLDEFGGNVSEATAYVGDLVAFSSSIYEDEVDTSLHIGYLKWWPGPNGGVDPWSQGGCSGALSEFRSYWNSNHDDIERTVAHMLSGKNTGCGIAYVGVLCNQSYGYGLTGSLSGNFDPLNPTSSQGFWDIMAMSHELGHNFGSPHTHCYGGILGNPEPVDECYGSENGSGCFQGTPSLPGCSPGGRCGTIMSYCHLRSGGYGNISLTFGAGHGFGEDPWRVPSVMNSHVSSRPASCVAPIVPDLIFEDDFESGSSGSWSDTAQ